MQTTTKTELNTILANEFLDVRARIKAMQAREKALKSHFNGLLDERESNDLVVNTAIIISRSERERTSYDTKDLDYYFTANGINNAQFKKTTSYTTLSVKAV